MVIAVASGSVVVGEMILRMRILVVGESCAKYLDVGGNEVILMMGGYAFDCGGV